MATVKKKLATDTRPWWQHTVTLTADGHEPFTHVSRSQTEDWKGAAQLCAEIWLLGHPERRVAKNISIALDHQERIEARS